ncbi:MAG: Na/Pi symporter, partial [Lentisphaeria bacterium]|nr:Na/Pi symporter [Lentisphaeria bacterium]
MFVSRLLRALGASGLCVLLVGLAGGCRPTAETLVAQVRVYRGAQQIGLPGETCPVPLQVEVLGPERQSALGGKPRRLPVPNVRVVAKPASADSGLAVDAAEAESDPAGHVRFQVTLGRRVGDQYLVLSCPDFPDVAPVTVRYVAGLSVKGGMQEVAAGDSLPESIRIRLASEDNQPLGNVPIYFRVTPPGTKAKLGADRVNTDENGLATLQMTTDPERTGRYEIIAEVSAPERGLAIRGIVIPVLAMNRIRLIIGVLGGLGIFIFGMKLMSDGLQQTAGDRLKAVLQFFTRNRVTAVFAGMVVTALIQSSSACTVMVVGFVNAGLLNLTQSIGIIFGAAIGTTVTAQMVSFKLDGVALPAIIVGVVMLFCSRRSYILGLAHAILGFGLLFFGMTMMSAELKVISDFPSFIGFFQMFDCTPAHPGEPMPLGAVLGAVAVGTVMTVIIQSSSATIGLAIALATSGLINFHTAVPLILGDNIGTTITAILASIGTIRNARQAAAASSIFMFRG